VPSTLVHVAVAGLVGAALLGDAVDRRSAAVVLVAGAIPDLDTFVGLYVVGAHRALLHTALLPAALAGLLAYETRRRPTSALRRRYGDRGVRIAWVAVAALFVGGVLPDLVTNGVNPFYPLVDRFYTLDGEMLLSSQRGFVQTFVDLSADEPARNTSNYGYYTGVDPAPRSPGAETGRNVERVFPVVRSGTQLLLVVAGFGTLAARVWEAERR
jgi:hypothetical protein